jgi:hypothetical protein
MMTVTITKNPNSGADSNFGNMAVWEAGYNICLEVCRAADESGDREASGDP